MSEKKFNPDLWTPLGIKPVEVKEVIQPGKLNSFLDYQAPDDRYEVRGIMPKAPESPKKDFLATALENCQKFNEEFEGTFDKS